MQSLPKQKGRPMKPAFHKPVFCLIFPEEKIIYTSFKRRIIAFKYPSTLWKLQVCQQRICALALSTTAECTMSLQEGGEDDWMDWEGKRCSNTVQVFQTCVSGGLLVFKQSLSVSRWSDRGLCPLPILLFEGSLCLMFAKPTHLLITVFEPGQEEQMCPQSPHICSHVSNVHSIWTGPRRTTPVQMCLLRCMPMTNKSW